MKTVLFFAVFLSVPAFAANNLYCRQVPSGPDHGYEAVFSNNLQRVSIQQQTIAGPRRVALLNCSRYAQRISCSEPRLRDAGYSLSVVASRRGLMRGSLYGISFAGSRRLANLVCQRDHLD